MNRGLGILALGLLLALGCSEAADDIGCPEGTVRAGDICVELESTEGAENPTDSNSSLLPGDEGGEESGNTGGEAQTTTSGGEEGTEGGAIPVSTTLPFSIDTVYAPSGYMGDGETPGAIEEAEACLDPRPEGAKGNCHHFMYTIGEQGWAGVFWQYPENNWGDFPGYAIPAGATEVTFSAWGVTGGEEIEFLVGMAGKDALSVSKTVSLTTEPQQYAISLGEAEYGEVIGAFGWTAGGVDTGLAFSVDNIQWVEGSPIVEVDDEGGESEETGGETPVVSDFPFIVDDVYSPSGYMGDGETGGVDETEDCGPLSPAEATGSCHAFTYTKGEAGWAGVFWQYPEDNWGDLPGYAMPAGATDLTFLAWSETEGQTVEFLVGITGEDTFSKSLEVKLTGEPTQYTIDLTGIEYTEVIGAFGWSIAGKDEPIVFYVDGIQWNSNEPTTSEGGESAGEEGGESAGEEGGEANVEEGGGSTGGESGESASDEGGDSSGEEGGSIDALPFPVDSVYTPSGYMGATDGITVEEICADPRPGEGLGKCHQFTLDPGATGWGGVYWQYPDNNWGDLPGYEIPQGATQVAFYAWGATGNEQVEFLVGLDGDPLSYTTGKIQLSTEPTQYTINITDPYDKMAGAFGWVGDAAITFSLDDIKWQ